MEFQQLKHKTMAALAQSGARCLLAGLCLAATTVRARTPEEQESRSVVMSAFLYNFLLFTEWPAAPALQRGPFLIGVLGENLFERAAATIEQRQAGGRAIRFVHFPAPEDITPTHILFVTDGTRATLDDVRRRIADHPVLLVGDSDRFTRDGGIIRFFEEKSGKEKALRVEINKTAADRAGIRFRSQLLRLAQVVNHPLPAEP